MENGKNNINKNKSLKKLMCYISLVFLVILLFIPVVFRIVFKEKKEEKKVDVITVLSCESSDESINSTFLNDEPKNILYQVLGNYNSTPSTEESEDETKDENTPNIGEKPVLKKLIHFGKLTYDEEQNISSLRVSVSDIVGSLDYEIIFSTVNNQEAYYKMQGFSCNISYK